jgi:hypothetical protein
MKKHEHQAIYEVCGCGAIRAQGQEWSEGGEGKNPAAQAMAIQRAARLSPADRSASAALGAATRWKGKKKQRHEYMVAIASRPRPSRRDPDRCPCGRFTRKRAEQRGHKCVAA